MLETYFLGRIVGIGPATADDGHTKSFARHMSRNVFTVVCAAGVFVVRNYSSPIVGKLKQDVFP